MSPVISNPKYLTLAQEIEARIYSGEWDNKKMPSLRVLAEAHGVSIVTAARAIQVLRERGLIEKAKKSNGYITIQDGESTCKEKWGLVLRVTPGEWQRASSAVSRYGFDSALGSENVEFVENFDLGEGLSRRGFQEQIRQAISEGVQGIFFLPSRNSPAEMTQDEKFLSTCATENLPVVLLDRNIRGHSRVQEYDLIAVNDFDGGLRTAEHLLNIGKQRIAIAVGSPTSSHDERVAGYSHALRIAKEQGHLRAENAQPTVLQLPFNSSTKDADRWLADELLRLKIDGIICYQDYAAIGLIVELLTRGKQIPKDIAVVGFDNLPIGDIFTMGVTSYGYPSEAIVRHALRVMRYRLQFPHDPPIKVSVLGELVIRESSVRQSQ